MQRSNGGAEAPPLQSGTVPSVGGKVVPFQSEPAPMVQGKVPPFQSEKHTQETR
jgi:hypothetical protein